MSTTFDDPVNFNSTVNLNGSSSGTITVQPQASAGTYNFNLPTAVGSSGAPLLSGGGGSSPMTWGAVTGTGSFVLANSPTLTGATINSTASLQVGAGSVISTLTQFQTWTPSDQSGASLTLTIDDARYAQIGNIVIVTFNITYPTNSSNVAACISVPVAVNAAFRGGIAIEVNGNLSIVACIAYGSGTTQINFQYQNGGTNVFNSALSGLYVRGTIIYST